MRSQLLKFSSVKPEPGPPPAATTAAEIPAVSATAAAEKVAGDPQESGRGWLGGMLHVGEAEAREGGFTSPLMVNGHLFVECSLPTAWT